MRALNGYAMLVLMLGRLNCLLVSLSQFDFVKALFAEVLTSGIYILFGASSVWLLVSSVRAASNRLRTAANRK